jgi:hypothetical protein
VNNENTLFIYPNPAKDLVILKLPGAAKFIIISDLMGKEILKINSIAMQDYPIDITSLPDGIYYLSVFQEDNSTLQAKIIVSRR